MECFVHNLSEDENECPWKEMWLKSIEGPIRIHRGNIKDSNVGCSPNEPLSMSSSIFSLEYEPNAHSLYSEIRHACAISYASARTTVPINLFSGQQGLE